MTSRDLDRALDALDDSHGDTFQERRNAVLASITKPVLPKRLVGASRLKAVVVCMPCNGFGDVVFGAKIRGYLRDWYGGIMDVDIVTANPGAFAQLGEKNVIGLHMSGHVECRRLKNARLPKAHRNMQPDLIFIAPLIEGSPVNFHDVRSMFPNSSPFNTYFLSAYNDVATPEIDFSTGLGDGRMGLLFTHNKPGAFPREIGRAGTPYAMSYVATSEQSPQRCVLGFMHMVATKYLPQAQKHGQFHIVSNDAVIVALGVGSLRSLAHCGYSGVVVRAKDPKDDTEIWLRTASKTAPVLYLRGDIYPLPHRRMQAFFYHSVRDVLVTGDQSITDAVAACPHGKTIWYQIMDWKKDLAKQLAVFTKNDALARQSTSCGGLDYVDFNKTSCDLLKHWDFRVLGKKLMDKVVAHAALRLKQPQLAEEEDGLLRTRA